MEDYSSYIVSLNNNVQPTSNIYADTTIIQTTSSTSNVSTNTNSSIISGNLLTEIEKDIGSFKDKLLSHPLLLLGGVCIIAYFVF